MIITRNAVIVAPLMVRITSVKPVLCQMLALKCVLICLQIGNSTCEAI